MKRETERKDDTGRGRLIENVMVLGWVIKGQNKMEKTSMFGSKTQFYTS